jgi:hypothetical protein
MSVTGGAAPFPNAAFDTPFDMPHEAIALHREVAGDHYQLRPELIGLLYRGGQQLLTHTGSFPPADGHRGNRSRGRLR